MPNTPVILTNPPIVSNGKIYLSWTGGVGPFQIEKCIDFNNPVFIPVTNPTLAREAILDKNTAQGFYRVHAELPLLVVIGLSLVWFAPELP